MSVDKKGNFITSKNDVSEEEEEMLPNGRVGEIPAVFVEAEASSIADILEDEDAEDDAEEKDLDELVEYLAEEDEY